MEVILLRFDDKYIVNSPNSLFLDNDKFTEKVMKWMQSLSRRWLFRLSIWEWVHYTYSEMIKIKNIIRTNQKNCYPGQTNIVEGNGILKWIFVSIGTHCVINVPINAVALVLVVLRKILLLYCQIANCAAIFERRKIGTKMHSRVVTLTANIVGVHWFVEIPDFAVISQLLDKY